MIGVVRTELLNDYNKYKLRRIKEKVHLICSYYENIYCNSIKIL